MHASLQQLGGTSNKNLMFYVEEHLSSSATLQGMSVLKAHPLAPVNCFWLAPQHCVCAARCSHRPHSIGHDVNAWQTSWHPVHAREIGECS